MRQGRLRIDVVGFAMFDCIRESLIGWWQGELQEQSLEEIYDDSAEERYKRHWTAVIARTLAAFYMAHWKWLWGAIIALLGSYLAYL